MSPTKFTQYLSGRSVGTRMHSAVSIAFLSTVFAAAVGTFSVSELPSIDSASPGLANAVNDRGDVVGRSFNVNSQDRSTAWVAGAASELLSLDGATNSEARAVSPSGIIVGVTRFEDYTDRATLWSSAGSAPAELRGLGGMNSYANAINAGGDVVGFGYVADNSSMHAILWATAGSGPVDLGTVGGAYSEATAVNTAGDIVGVSEDAAGTMLATLWSGPTHAAVALPLLPGGKSSRANGINDNGDIVGIATDASWNQRAVLWPVVGRQPVDLGTLGGLAAGAKAINASGDIVGYSTTAGEVRHATLWSGGASAPPASTCKSGVSSRSKGKSNSERNSRSDKRRVSAAPVSLAAVSSASVARVAQDLTPTGAASEASGINASGQIVGFAENGASVNRAMVWKSLSAPPPAPGGTPSGNHQGNHQNEGEEEGDC